MNKINHSLLYGFLSIFTVIWFLLLVYGVVKDIYDGYRLKRRAKL